MDFRKRAIAINRCEGWRRYGGVFTFGPVQWVQCENNAIVILTVSQDKVTRQPSCLDCWEEAIEREIPILSARAISRGINGL